MNLEGIDLQNLLTLLGAMGFALMVFQRTERKRKIWTGLLFALPLIFLLWRISIYNRHLREFYFALGGAVAFNLLFWLIYGRHHPPGSKGDITVYGSEN